MHDVLERGREQPGGRDDVCAALLLEEEGEPEGQVGAARGSEGWGLALSMSQS